MLLALFLFGFSASAHRSKGSFTEVLYSEASNRLEITHQIHLHDAQTALNVLTGDPSSSLFHVSEQARLLRHVRAQFALTADGQEVGLDIIGAEIDGDHVYMLFESAQLSAPKAVSARHDIFRDFYPDQINQMNITVGPILRTLIFRRADEVKNTLF